MARSNEKETWADIRLTLNQKYTYDIEWEKAIKLFDDRICNKYFLPLQQLIVNDTGKGEGFTITTVLCSLIEMFAAFKKGVIYNNQKSSKYEYNKSKELFVNFLHNASIFRGHFWTQNNGEKKSKDVPYSAAAFYSEVRCSLVHEARTKGDWHINTLPSSPVSKNATIFIEKKGIKVKIYRTVLYYRLLQHMQDYQNELRKDSKGSKILRRNFARKMDNLFDFPSDSAYEWWR
ncbi:hypothetical protein [Flavobacterium lindanitolerans]|uniref:hypothetical protein n=1 Tax=Flavobacterium lindanitolerans TaxID=428988 RepID=UPI0027BAD155|nr:hypothetical protein [Flavobacterium lindanitolerans]